MYLVTSQEAQNEGAQHAPELALRSMQFRSPGNLIFPALDQKLKQNVAQIIIYYHATKQLFPSLSLLLMCLQFQNMFWKNISCFLF